jgi:hypothetical protein
MACNLTYCVAPLDAGLEKDKSEGPRRKPHPSSSLARTMFDVLSRTATTVSCPVYAHKLI